jgi:protocatechuate 3,4-dioxygenase beta subunit
MRRLRTQAVATHEPRLLRDLAVMERQLYGRRRLLGWLAGGTVAAVVASTSTAAAVAEVLCTAAPEETNGPFPADGSRAPFGRTLNVLKQSGIVRRDITRSFGSSTTLAAGVPLTLTITLKSAHRSCAPLAGHALYVWHCDRNGDYSMYAEQVAGENYLRGVQVSDASGQVSFQTIFPACYSGRYPHIHLEVYASAALAAGQTRPILTSQLALPRDTCARVYSSGSGYDGSLANLAELNAADDMVFADSTPHQLAAQTVLMQGSVAAGFTASAVVAVS